jgi:adenine-specific DNA-methyltransferase
MKKDKSKMNGKSLNITEDKKAKLKELFPEVFTENGIDWEKLKIAFGEDVNFQDERYFLNWAGKSDSFRALQAQTTATLIPDQSESVNFNTTENIFIEGENLEVLKILQKSYYGKIKMIYIDPPYNTGSDSFVYPDKFAETKEEYLQRTGGKDEEGYLTREGFFKKNSKDSGHYHSNWLSMMYPRLFLAKNLLKEDGFIFVSIDDNEVHNLRLLMNEVFGEENFIDVLVWKKRYNAAKEHHLAIIHEYVLIYSKDKAMINDFSVPGSKDYYEKHFTEMDEHFNNRGKFMTQPLEAGNSMGARPNLCFPIETPDGTALWPRRQWVWKKEKVNEAIKNGYLKFYKDKDGNWKVRHKQYERDD